MISISRNVAIPCHSFSILFLEDAVWLVLWNMAGWYVSHHFLGLWKIIPVLTFSLYIGNGKSSQFWLSLTHQPSSISEAFFVHFTPTKNLENWLTNHHFSAFFVATFYTSCRKLAHQTLSGLSGTCPGATTGGSAARLPLSWLPVLLFSLVKTQAGNNPRKPRKPRKMLEISALLLETCQKCWKSMGNQWESSWKPTFMFGKSMEINGNQWEISGN